MDSASVQRRRNLFVRFMPLWIVLGVAIYVSACLLCLGGMIALLREGYSARVERVQPAIPGLLVESFPSAYGALKITNRTGRDVSIRCISATSLVRVQWQAIPPNGELLFACEVEYRGRRAGEPTGFWPGHVMKSWAVLGQMGDTSFVIYGLTVYDPLPP